MTLELARDNGMPAATNGTAALEQSPFAIRGLTVSYGEKPAVFSVDMTVEAGKMTAIIGPNGAGKSTLLKAALGVVPPVSGLVQVLESRWTPSALGSLMCPKEQASTGISQPA